MTAGRGISHSERFTHPDSYADGGLELMQLWVALPEADEETEPAFTHYPASDLPVLERDGVWMRLVAGSAYGETSPVRTHSPLFYLHTEWQAGASLALPGGYRGAGGVCGQGGDRTRRRALPARANAGVRR